jgi:hypothetical protein
VGTTIEREGRAMRRAPKGYGAVTRDQSTHHPHHRNTGGDVQLR